MAKNNPATSWNVLQTCAATCLLSFVPSGSVSSLLLGLMRMKYSGQPLFLVSRKYSQDPLFFTIENFRFFLVIIVGSGRLTSQ